MLIRIYVNSLTVGLFEYDWKYNRIFRHDKLAPYFLAQNSWNNRDYGPNCNELGIHDLQIARASPQIVLYKNNILTCLLDRFLNKIKYEKQGFDMAWLK